MQRAAGMIEVDEGIFKNLMKDAFSGIVSPPTAKTTGTRLRSMKPFVTARETIIKVMSTTNGMPAEDEAASIARTEEGDLKPAEGRRRRRPTSPST